MGFYLPISSKSISIYPMWSGFYLQGGAQSQSRLSLLDARQQGHVASRSWIF